MGAASSRQTVTAGSSARSAAEEFRQSQRVAANLLEAAEADLEVSGGRVHVKGVPGMSIGLGEIASQLAGAATGFALPAGEKPGLEAHVAELIEGLAFSNGAHVAEIEVDADTGDVKVLNYVIAHDCGVMVNPLVIDGQVAGGAAHQTSRCLRNDLGRSANLIYKPSEYLIIGRQKFRAFKSSTSLSLFTKPLE